MEDDKQCPKIEASHPNTINVKEVRETDVEAPPENKDNAKREKSLEATRFLKRTLPEVMRNSSRDNSPAVQPIRSSRARPDHYESPRRPIPIHPRQNRGSPDSPYSTRGRQDGRDRRRRSESPRNSRSTERRDLHRYPPERRNQPTRGSR
jgi:hypothetical protein